MKDYHSHDVLFLPTMSVCQMISTYHNDLLRKLAKRYQAPSGNHNILIYSEWQQWHRQGGGGLSPPNDLKDHPCEKMKSEEKLKGGR